jgi:hypothetical protein
VCVAILQIANARNHFSPGDDKHRYGGMANLAADQSVTIVCSSAASPTMKFGSPYWRFGQYRRRGGVGKMLIGRTDVDGFEQHYF